MPKPSFEVSPDVRKLAEFIGTREHVTYADMNRRIGRQTNGRDRYVLYGALRQLQRESGAVYVVEHNVGIKRATNGQKAELSTDHVHHKVKRTMRRAKKIEDLVNTQELTNDQRDAFYVGRSINQAVVLSISRKMRSKIEKEIVDRGGEAVDVTEVIALFRKRAH